MIEFLKKVISDQSGDPSTMRFLSWIIICTVLFNWTWYNISQGEILSFDWQEMSLIIGTLFAKGYQKGKEK